jgi:maltose-binding protein MalE
MYKKRFISWMLTAILFTTLLAGCQTSDSKKTDTTNAVTEAAATNTPEETKPVTIKIWHDGNEAIMSSIEKQLNEALLADKITVTFEKKTGLTDQLKLYGNDKANGPDMYFYAHDSLGTFVEMGIVSPLKDILDSDTSLFDGLFPMTVTAGTYQGERYFLPVYFETLLFLYNKDLWQGDIPSTTEELYTYMEAHTDTSAGTYAVVNQHSTAYNVAPFINGYGGYIIDESGNPGLDNAATKEAIVYNQKFAALQADGDYNTVTTLFNKGEAQAIIGGPWLVPGIQEAGINLGIKSLSGFTLPNGNSLAPYSGVQGVGVLKTALDKKDALAKVLHALANKDLGVSLAKEFNCAPAAKAAYDDPEVSANEMVVAMKDTAGTAQPMPNIPQMSVMWGPTEALLAAVNKSNASIEDASAQYQKEAKTAISDMQ